ncbi:hypothetical protein [Candidatus Poriferisodalis sp.]|uniref:hypothetical protein n=1 Tax=Candidatus Poriferisodalis sp. TaxID=3101277 RepID=UPI003B51CB32
MLTIFNPGIDAEGEEIVHQFGVLQDHPREAVYNLCGNHDRGMWRTHYLVKWSVPKSHVLTFTEGSDEVRVRCYMHTDEFRTQGWYTDDEQVLKLSQSFAAG